MKKGIKVLVLMVCVPLIILGVLAMFVPTSHSELFNLHPKGVFGLNTIRGVIGGLLLGSAFMMIIGVLKNDSTWFLATIVMMAVVIFGRIISIFADGWSNDIIFPLVAETVIIVVLYLAHIKSTQSK
jgi:prolipoprotein diacylglyceryltransferase